MATTSERKPKKKQPTERTLEWLRKAGYTAEKTEHWNHFARQRKDLLGFIDVLAMRQDGAATIGVQATTAANVNARIHKILGLESARIWLRGPGHRVWIMGWRKVKTRWEPVMREVTLDMFPEAANAG